MCTHRHKKEKKTNREIKIESKRNTQKTQSKKKTPKEKSIYQPLRAVEINFFNVKVNKQTKLYIQKTKRNMETVASRGRRWRRRYLYMGTVTVRS